MIAIVDYGVGNLFSLCASLEFLNIECEVTADKDKIRNASHVILPGVGAFGDASKLLFESGLGDVILEIADKKPIMGICLGMQLLFENGHEFGVHKGLGIIKGDIVSIKDDLKSDLKIPHMGWNKLKIVNDSPILKYVSEKDSVYFVHSFYAKTDKSFITSVSEYEIDITATVQKNNIFGCQFHPEKSGEVGLSILKAFSEYNILNDIKN